MKKWLTMGLGLLVVFALAGCNESSSSPADGVDCQAKTGPGGICATIQVCCTTALTNCYVLAAGQKIDCPSDNCAAPSVLEKQRAACTLAVDGDTDAEHETLVDGDPDPISETEVVVDGDVDPISEVETVVDGDVDPISETDLVVDGDSDLGPPSSHTDAQKGILHNTGKNDPLKNCVACHGADLKGGTGRSCYSCHNNASHTRSERGNMHLNGASSTCTACHGPTDKEGGLGPACTKCHRSVPN